jgi:serine/threonine protein kinase
MDVLRRYRWKLADFGISTAGTAKRLIATKHSRGTQGHRAPEIIFSEPTVPSYTNKVDIWGLGLILYQLLTGKNAFQSDFDVMQYRSDGICPQLSVTSSVFERVIPDSDFFAAESPLSMLDKAARLVLSVGPGPLLAVRGTALQPSRRFAINKLLDSLLQRDPTLRPTIEHVCLLVAANMIATHLEFHEKVDLQLFHLAS